MLGFINMNDTNFNLTEAEEKAMVGIVYNHLAYATTMELFGELGEKGIERVENLRIALGKLFCKYDLSDSLPTETFLLLGMLEFLKGDDLKKWSEMETNKHMQNRAKFFLVKMKK